FKRHRENASTVVYRTIHPTGPRRLTDGLSLSAPSPIQTICIDCTKNRHLKDRIRHKGVQGSSCSVCGHQGVPAIDAKQFIRHVHSVIRKNFFPVDLEEGGGETLR